MRETNLIGLILAVFLCIALCMNGVMQERERARYEEVKAKVIDVETHRYYDHDIDSYVVNNIVTLVYAVDGNSYSHTKDWEERVVPSINATRPLYIDPNNPEDVMDSNVIMREIGTFASAGVALVWAILQLYIGIKHAKSTAEVRSAYFILTIGILITLSSVPLAYFLHEMGIISMCAGLIGLIVIAWGVKDISSQKKKTFYYENVIKN